MDNQTDRVDIDRLLDDTVGNGDSVPDNVVQFSEILNKMVAVYISKNKDYGNSGDITYLMFGEDSVLIRLWDKLLRLTQLHLTGNALVKDESFNDTLLDMANYAVMALVARAKYANKPIEETLPDALTQFFSNLKAGTTKNDN